MSKGKVVATKKVKVLPPRVTVKANLERAQERLKKIQGAVASWAKAYNYIYKGLQVLRELATEQDGIVKAIKAKRPVVRHVPFKETLNVD